MPSSMSILEFQPRLFISELSMSFRGVPLGLVVSQVNSPPYFSTSAIRAARSRMLISLPEPTFTERSGALAASYAASTFSTRKSNASARSSTCRNSLNGEPSPHNATGPPSFLASSIFRINAASTWDVSRSKLSPGP